MVSAIVSETRTPRLDSLTSLRWWAALAVFFFHVRNVVPLPGPIGGAIGPQHGAVGIVWIVTLLAASGLLVWGLHALIERPAERWLRAWQNGVVARRVAARAAAPRTAIEQPEQK